MVTVVWLKVDVVWSTIKLALHVNTRGWERTLTTGYTVAAWWRTGRWIWWWTRWRYAPTVGFLTICIRWTCAFLDEWDRNASVVVSILRILQRWKVACGLG